MLPRFALLNWDHEINPTPVEDLQATLFNELKATGAHLTDNSTLAIYNAEIIGRVLDNGYVVLFRQKVLGDSHIRKACRKPLVDLYNKLLAELQTC